MIDSLEMSKRTSESLKKHNDALVNLILDFLKEESVYGKMLDEVSKGHNHLAQTFKANPYIFHNYIKKKIFESDEAVNLMNLGYDLTIDKDEMFDMICVNIRWNL